MGRFAPPVTRAADGNSTIPWQPSPAAGQQLEYLGQAVPREFRRRPQRNDPVMRRASPPRSAMATCRAVIAAWLHAQAPGRTAIQGQATPSPWVNAFYRGGIQDRQVAARLRENELRHSPNGSGIPAQYPRLPVSMRVNTAKSLSGLPRRHAQR